MFTMMQTVGATLLLCLIFAVTGADVQGSEQSRPCAKKYSRINPGHTMCLPKSPYSSRRRMSEAEKALIVEMHNNIRAELNATNMQKVQWDYELAKIAVKWALQCPNGREDDPDKRKTPDLPGYIGQNYAVNKPNLTMAVKDWYTEKRLFWLDGQTGHPETRNYEQLIWAPVDRIGCGVAKCVNSAHTRYLICNYHTGPTEPERPFVKGQQCSQCPNHCENNLCDCTGFEVCMEGTTRDVATCQCN